MSEVLQKLLFKNQPHILVHNPPPEFQPHLTGLPGETRVDTSIAADARYPFALVFVTRTSEIAALAADVIGHMDEDGMLWFAYPKGTSGRYATDISRDQGWQPLGDLGFEGVGMVAIDDDWSAFRFRHTSFIKKAPEPTVEQPARAPARQRRVAKKAVRPPTPKRRVAKKAAKKAVKKAAKKPTARTRARRPAAGGKKTRRSTRSRRAK
jgi:hypothetical protein